jgi:hypothetical protein
METAALSPPAWLERLVRSLTPPLAREAVLGDLCETYISPRQYAFQALGILPFVIASQMRRHLNLPALLLQAALVYVCFGATAACAIAPLLMLRDAFQPATRPSHVWALRQAVLVAVVGLAALQLFFAIAQQAWAGEAGAVLIWLELFVVGPILLPVLCLLRTGLIVDSDRRPVLAENLSADELTAAITAFARRARWMALLEAATLAATALFVARTSAVLAGCFGVAALYLMVEGFSRIAVDGDFISLRAAFIHALSRQRQLRRFLWWLWLAPLLLALQGRYIHAGLAHGNAGAVILGAAGVTLLCFLAAAMNREHGGRTQEQIGLLEHMRERVA